MASYEDMKEQIETFQELWKNRTEEEVRIIAQGRTRGLYRGLLYSIGTVALGLFYAPRIFPKRGHYLIAFAPFTFLLGNKVENQKAYKHLSTLDTPLGRHIRECSAQAGKPHQHRHQNTSPSSVSPPMGQPSSHEFAVDRDHVEEKVDEFVQDHDSVFQAPETSGLRTMEDLRKHNRSMHDSSHQASSSSVHQPQSMADLRERKRQSYGGHYSQPPQHVHSSPSLTSSSSGWGDELLDDSAQTFGSTWKGSGTGRKGSRYNDEGFE